MRTLGVMTLAVAVSIVGLSAGQQKAALKGDDRDCQGAKRLSNRDGAGCGRDCEALRDGVEMPPNAPAAKGRGHQAFHRRSPSSS